MPLKLDCSLLACLILGFSQNALLRTTCELRDCSLVYPTISSIVQQEYKGLDNNYMVPPILIDTPGVSSSQCTSRKYPTNATLVVEPTKPTLNLQVTGLWNEGDGCPPNLIHNCQIGIKFQIGHVFDGNVEGILKLLLIMFTVHSA